jgi:hypothetical protein
MEENCSFSRLETEFSFQVSPTPLWSLVSLEPGRIKLWRYKQIWRPHVALQLWLLPLLPRWNRFGVTKGGSLVFQCIFVVVLSAPELISNWSSTWLTVRWCCRPRGALAHPRRLACSPPRPRARQKGKNPSPLRSPSLGPLSSPSARHGRPQP